MRDRKRVVPLGAIIFLGASLLLTGCSFGLQSTTPVFKPVDPPLTQQPAPAPPSDQQQAPQPDTTPVNMPQPQEEELVPYTGPVEHIFFHPLIAYPELAFDHDAMSTGYNDWFVTVPEFDKIIDSLYQKNFVLIDIHDMYDVKEVNGKKVLTQKELKLPQGKKPMILSIDDLNYYDYMLQNGNVYKLILDENGNIATYSVNPQGEKVISHDNEIIPILDQFVQQHPDFSFHGAKGLIALTGYQGILGYRTNQLNSSNYQQEKSDVLLVIDRLKATGWSFASHGYGHLDASAISYNRLVSDTEQWKKEVEPLIGDTDVYIYPFGSRAPTGGDKFQYLLNAGFDALCSVGPTSYVQYTPNALMMDRRHIDGISLHSQRSYLLDLFDSNEVIDKVRPPEY